MNRWILPLVIGSLLLALGCGSDSPAGPTGADAPTPVATTLTLSATVLSFSTFGETEQLTATVRDQNGATLSGASVAWASSPLSVASVSSTGLVTAVADGTATITATSGSATGTSSVTVQQAAVPAGGEVSLAAGAVTLVFPAGAVSAAVVITAEPAIGLPAGPVPIPGTAFDFGPDGTVFAEPVTLTIGYDPANVPLGVPEEELRLHKLVGSIYVQVDAGVVDVANHTVSGAIDGFSVFAILRRSWQIFFEDNFDGDNLDTSNWTQDESTPPRPYSLTGSGELRIAGDTDGDAPSLIYNTAISGNYVRVTTKFRTTQDDAIQEDVDILILLNIDATVTNGYALLLTSDPFGATRDYELIIIKVTNDVLTVLSQASMGGTMPQIGPNNDYILEGSNSNGTITFTVKDDSGIVLKSLSILDSSYSGGKIGINGDLNINMAGPQSIFFDYVRVEKFQ